MRKKRGNGKEKNEREIEGREKEREGEEKGGQKLRFLLFFSLEFCNFITLSEGTHILFITFSPFFFLFFSLFPLPLLLLLFYRCDKKHKTRRKEVLLLSQGRGRR